jgi:hypothetical protein
MPSTIAKYFSFLPLFQKKQCQKQVKKQVKKQV